MLGSHQPPPGWSGLERRQQMGPGYARARPETLAKPARRNSSRAAARSAAGSGNEQSGRGAEPEIAILDGTWAVVVANGGEGVRIQRTFILVIALMVGWTHPASAHEGHVHPEDITVEQRLNEQVPPDLAFRDETGRAVQLGDYLGERPVLLTMNYYTCRQLCPAQIQELSGSLQEVRFEMGEEFQVVTVSVNPDETPADALAAKQRYTKAYERPGLEEGWHFLTGEEASIRRLAQTVGVRYAYDAGQDQYAHPAAAVLLTPQGRIARYIFPSGGIEFSPQDLRLGLVDASANKIGTVIDKVLLSCFSYDPAIGKYTPYALGILRLGGIATVIALGTFVFVLRRAELRQNRGTTGRME